ncbi:GntR family transcriptional regulator [Brachybacterium ginsengisoli]|uniref:GntR family transcriptional regulator n=1 Tax=Brachybacterium ginsengisoli TaxID=1331682 RepID=A0A291GZE7_9MICO|nr:PLP-dependent aminotransferase family protein [Brachybacterium ginsengisoli]ATG55591.1 GntR family transcriptional regulator [Brachybacterium ginsengisoli]
MTTTTRSAPHDLLSALGAREDLSRGFGKASTSLPGAIPLLGGAPSADLLPLAEIRDAAADLTADTEALVGALQYSLPRGISGLRRWIAEREGVDPERVLITNGAFHGLSLLFDALLEQGDEVAVEDPTYPLIFRSLQHKQPRLLPLPLDAEGIDAGALEAQLNAGARPKLLYTVPDFHNPTGLVTSAWRREQLVGIAERHGLVIVSDNAYAGLGFPGTQEVADYPLDSDLVVHVRTFSKVLGPGLRLGWLVLPPWLVGPVTRLRANQDQHSSVPIQAIVERIVGAGEHSPRGGGFDAIAQRSATAYAERFDLVHGILEEGLPDGIEVTHRTGGIFLWARLRDAGIDLRAAQELARTRYGTDAVLGRFFHLGDPTDDRGSLRLGISHLPPEQLRRGAERLLEALTSPEARR